MCPHPPDLTRNPFSRTKHPLHTPRSTPSCISIQDPSRRVEVLRGTHYSEYPPTKKRCVVRWFDQKCYAYTQDYPSSRKLRGDYLTLRRRRTARRGFTAQGPCRGNEVIPANRRCSAPHNIGIGTLSGRT